MTDKKVIGNVFEMKKRKPNQEIVALLEAELIRAKQGFTQGIFITTVAEPHQYTSCCLWSGTISFFEMIGSAEDAKYRAIKKFTD